MNTPPSAPLRVGVVAGSSVVPQIEFSIGIDHLRNSGFDVRVHKQCAEQSFTFAGNDESRATALFEYASDPSLDVIWMARGGYGTTRMLPLLEKFTREKGKPPRKLLIGYSDVTALHEFAHRHWGWPTLHAPMPAASNFSSLQPIEWIATNDYVNRRKASPAWAGRTYPFWGEMPAEGIVAPVYGGNLTVWNCLTGTAWQPPADHPRILFFEDIDEAPYRIDRMVVQLTQSRGFQNVNAILLGDFTGCNDSPGDCLAADPRTTEKPSKKPLRKQYSLDESLEEIFKPLAEKLRIPILRGLPVGHGPNYSPLPLGAVYRLTPAASIELVSWDWLAK